MAAPIFNAVLTGNWGGLGSALGRLSVQFPVAMQAALVEEGEFYRNKIVTGIREQAPGDRPFKPLSPVTIALRKMAGFRGTKALIRTGELRNSVVSVAQKGVVFVGILYTARGEDGRKLADIGKVHEYGAVVRVAISKKRMAMIAALMRKSGMRGAGSGGGAGLGMIRIPARPFIRPVFDKYGGARGAQRYMARVSRKLGGLLGVINHPDLGGHKVSQMPEKFLGGRGGKSVGNVRKGLTPAKRAPRKSSMFKRLGKNATRGARPRSSPVKLKRVARAPRPPRVIRPKLRQARPKVAKPRFKPIRPPKPPRVPGPRKPRAPRAPSAKAQAAAGRRNAAHAARQQKRAQQLVARVQRQGAAGAAKVRKQGRAQAAKLKQQNRQNRRQGRRIGRHIKAEQTTQKRYAKNLKAAAKRQAKLARQDQRNQREMERAYKDANRFRKQMARKVKAEMAAERKRLRLEKRAAREQKKAALEQKRSARAADKKYREEKKAGLHRPHDSHVRSHRGRIKARARRALRKQQHDSHVRAYRAQGKTK